MCDVERAGDKLVSTAQGEKKERKRTDDVGALLRHVDEVTAGTVGELDSVDGALL